VRAGHAHPGHVRAGSTAAVFAAAAMET
jgi:hypothetical protein